ncbi:MAG: copper amine oxidase N-terminal domain-containing protein [Cellulomonadaceae bacterium]|jgi:hypothetical protein|nr:copper amine oxidase N-terminal domain-containing protein [Cellulomonadaceae bacterium]
MSFGEDRDGEVVQSVVPQRSPLRWVWWLLGLLALAALAWLIFHGFNNNNQQAANPLPPALTASPTVSPTDSPAAPATPAAPVETETPAETETPIEPTEPAEPTEPETDWSQYPIIINGVGITDNFQTIGDDQIFPTHVPLIPVAQAFGAQYDISTIPGGYEVTLEGLQGQIHFSTNSDGTDSEGARNTVTVGDNNSQPSPRVIALDAPITVIGDVIYVPLNFWRDAFGASSATFEGGHVRITSEATDMS